uniref:Adenylyl cyclase-associated protein n=1 Tax=Trepomonas sp. PC1 TaxID=1076344 RepID=A0A146K8R7_9EUKA|eukprot:JAP92748.1 Adenylyl cyclase-associated protein [Trepomonas sp. PC1]
MDLSKFESLVHRLESAVSALESNKKPKQQTCKIQEELLAIVSGMDPFLAISKQIHADVFAAAEQLRNNLAKFSQLCGASFTCKKPSNQQLKDFIEPLLKRLPAPQLQYKSHFQAIESLFELVHVVFNPVLDFAQGQLDSMEYYNNRVRQGPEPGKQWAAELTKTSKSIFSILEKYFEDQKFEFKGTEEWVSIQTEQKVQKTDNTEPLKAPNSAVKEKIQKYDQKRRVHILENILDEKIELEVEINQSVQLFNCKNVQVFIKNKVNLVQIAQSKEIFVQLESCVSQTDIIQSQKITIQVLNTIPTFNIESSQQIKLYLSNNALSAEVVHFCSDDIKVIQFEDEDEKEFCICTHFLFKIENGKVKNEIVEAQGE